MAEETPPVKIVLVGDSNVGKTTLFLKIQGNESDHQAGPTVSGECARFKIRLASGGTRNLFLWDTAGQEKYRALVPLYFKGANYAIVVFDLTSPASFEHLSSWIDLVKQTQAKPGFILVGNKCDLEERVVSLDIADKFATTIGALCYLETSARRGDNVDEIIARIGMDLVESRPREEAVTLSLTNPKTNRSCC
jgi:small GTP-binding protein